MKQPIFLIAILALLYSCTKPGSEAKVKLLLSDQLKYSHTDENWFVPTQLAIAGLTAEQSNWKDTTDTHSIGELVYHLTFWNELQLRAFKGEDFSDVKVDNDTTFTAYTEAEWEQVTGKLDSVQAELQLLIEGANEAQLSEWSADILNIASHNAYHAGQIIFIRKQKGWWSRK